MICPLCGQVEPEPTVTLDAELERVLRQLEAAGVIQREGHRYQGQPQHEPGS